MVVNRRAALVRVILLVGTPETKTLSIVGLLERIDRLVLGEECVQY